MTVKEAFKVGFVTELVRQGVTPEAFDGMLHKRANMGLPGAALGLAAMKGVGGGVELAGGIGEHALGAGLVGIPAISALGGWALGSQDKVTKHDIKDLEQLAAVHEYQFALDRMKRQDEAHRVRGKKRVQSLPAGQSTQEVVQPEMAAKVAAARPSETPVSPLPGQDGIKKNLIKAKSKLSGKPMAPPQPIATPQPPMPGPALPVGK